MTATRVKYIGTALPADTDTENLFSTQVSANTGFFQHAQIAKVNIKLFNDQAGTLKAYKSDDGGTTWDQIDQVSVAAVASNDVNEYEWAVEGYLDWKVDWVNTVTCTAFNPQISLITDRAAVV